MEKNNYMRTATICGKEYLEDSNIIVQTSTRQYHCVIVNGQIRVRGKMGKVTVRSKTISPSDVMRVVDDPTNWEGEDE